MFTDFASGNSHGVGSTALFPRPFYHNATGKVLIVARSPAFSDKLILYRMDPNGDNLVVHDISASQDAFSGYFPTSGVLVGNRLYLTNRMHYSNTISFYNISLTTMVSAYTDVSIALGLGSNSGFTPTIAYDSTNRALVIASYAIAPAPPGLFVARSVDGGPWTMINMTAGEAPTAGSNPVIAVDTANARLLIVTTSFTASNAPGLFHSGLAGLTPTYRPLVAAAPAHSGYEASVAVDYAGNLLLVIATDISYSTLTFFRCTLSTLSGCNYTNNLAPGGPANSGRFPGIVLTGGAGMAFVSGQTATGSTHALQCNFTQVAPACTRMGISIGTGTGFDPGTTVVQADVLFACRDAASFDTLSTYRRRITQPLTAFQNHKVPAVSGNNGINVRAVIDESNWRMLAAATQGSNGNRVVVYSCMLNGDGSGLSGPPCDSFDISTLAGRGADSGVFPWIVLDTIANRIAVVVLDPSNQGRLGLYACTQDILTCTYTDVSSGQGPNSAGNFRVALDMVTLPPQVVVVTQSTAHGSRFGFYRFGTDGASPAYEGSIAVGRSINSAFFPTMDIDEAGGRVLAVAVDGSSGSTLWLSVCQLDGTGCASANITTYAATEPSATVDRDTGALLVVTMRISDTRLVLVRCPLAGLGSVATVPPVCTSTDMLGMFAQLSAPSAITRDGRLYIVGKTTSSATPFDRAWLLSTSLVGTDPVYIDMSGGQPAESAVYLNAFRSPVGVMAVTHSVPSYRRPVLYSQPTLCPATPPPPLAEGYNTTSRTVGTVRSVVCSPGYLSNSTAQRCTQAITWTPAIVPPCVPNTNCPTNATTTTAVLAAPTYVAGQRPAVVVTPRNTVGSQVLCNDTWSLVSLPSLAPVPITLSFTGFNAVLSLASIPTATSSQSLQVVMSGKTLAPLLLVVGPSSTSPAHVLVTVPPLIIGATTELTVTARDGFGNLRLVGGDTVAYQLRQNSVLLPLPPRADLGNGNYTLALSPTSLDPYILTVSVNNTEVAGSPFSLLPQPVACSPGERRVGVKCITCPAAQFSAGGDAADCDLCPEGTSSPPGTGILANCTCVVGRYRLSDPALGLPCTACPPGAGCLGGDVAPQPQPGYGPKGPATFVQCPRPQSCVGGAAVCAAGYRGFLCKDCARDYYAASNGECLRCPPSPKSLLAAYCIIIAVLVVAAFTLVMLSLRSSGPDKSKDPAVLLRVRLFPATLSLCVSALQILGVLGLANLSWSSASQRALNGFNLFSLDLNLFSSKCSLPSFALSYILAVATPLVFLVLLFALAAIFRLCTLCVSLCSDLPKLSFRSLFLTVLLTAGPLVYLPLARSTLVLFACTPLPDGRFYLTTNLEVRCFDAAWMRLLPVGLLGVALYVIAIPGAIFGLLLANRRALFTQPITVQSYGAVYRLFRVRFYGTAVVLMARKLLLALASLFLARSQLVQSAAFLLVITGGGVLQAKLQPYYYPLLNRVEAGLAGCLSVVLGAGVLFYARAGTQHSPPAEFVFISIVFFIGLVALLVCVVAAVAADLREILVEREARATGAAGANFHDRELISNFKRHALDVLDRDMIVSALGGAAHKSVFELALEHGLELEGVSRSGAGCAARDVGKQQSETSI